MTHAARPVGPRWRQRLAGAAVTVALFVAALVVGLVLGWRWQSPAARGLESVFHPWLLEESAVSEYVAKGGEAGRTALHEYLAFLEAPGSPPDDAAWLTGRGLPQEKAFTLARLALLEEAKSEGTVDADALWSRAEAELRAAGWIEPTRARLRTVVRQLDHDRKPRGDARTSSSG